VRAVLIALVAALGVDGALAVRLARADANSEARVFFEQGNERLAAAQRLRGARRRRALEEALAAYVSSVRIVRSRNAVFNAAVVLQELERREEAFDYFAEYLGMPGVTEEDRADATRRLEALRPRVAVLAIESAPSGASVRVDRRDLAPRGRTPLEIAVPAGDHTLYFEREGCDPAEVVATAVVGERREVRATLREHPRQEPTGGGVDVPPPARGEGALEVRTDDPGARVLVDGVEVGRGREVTATVPEGPHFVRVDAPGRLPYETTANVGAGLTSRLEVRLGRRERTGPGAGATVSWIATGALGAAALAAGGYAVFSLSGRHADARARYDATQTQADYDAYRSLRRELVTFNLVADVLGGVALAAGVLSLVLALTGGGERETPATGAITVVPLAGVGTLGGALAGRLP
jgi:hypothetical protein